MHRSIRGFSGKALAVAALALPLAPFPAQARYKEKVLYSFTGGTDGSDPRGQLVMDATGNLYGTTRRGGTGGLGTVFKLSRRGKETVLHSFGGGLDGATPLSGLIADAMGNFYGTTEIGGGSCNCGTVFKVASKRKTIVLHAFGNYPDGYLPEAGVIRDAKGNLYGTTEFGGDGYGTVFKVTRKGKATVLYSFNPGDSGIDDGSQPLAGLTMDGSGNLFGTTYYGGQNNSGIIFKVTPDGAETVLHSFGYADGGGHPEAGMIMDPDGNLYGATLNTVFKFTSAGDLMVLHTFAGGSDGAHIRADLRMDSNGNLYGTTLDGGIDCDGTGDGCGVVFKITPAGKESVLHRFVGGSDGAYPGGSLTIDANGTLYGTTAFGGASDAGIVFELKNR